jgi:hypothetical protein
LLIVLCVTTAGTEDFADIERWTRRKFDFLRRFSPVARGILSRDTLNDVMNALPTRRFLECFVAWVQSLRGHAPDIVAIDGKTSRRAHAADGAPCIWSPPGPPANAWCSARRRSTRKSNEIVAMPRLLEWLELVAPVTIDAMGSEREIAEAIRAKGADCLFALKDNWPTLVDDVRLFFGREPRDTRDVCAIVDGDHDRIETYRCRVFHSRGCRRTPLSHPRCAQHD